MIRLAHDFSSGYADSHTLVEAAEANVVVVIPAYNEARKIAGVLKSVPAFVRHIVVVEDCGQDNTAEIVERAALDDERIVLVRHERNQGVGGAMISGFRKALELHAEVVVKMDGDGQMPSEFLTDLIEPLLLGQADFTKGNRFHDFRALARMPVVRRAGNVGLSFCTKAAVGYWTCFDPCNGYIAIRGEILAALPLDSLHRSYFFETSLLAQLYLLGAVVRDVSMPARYGDETSHLSVARVLVEFPPKLVACLLRRLLLKNFLYDFSMESLYLLAALPLLLGGSIFGGWNWFEYARAGAGAPTGTVVIPAMLIILGFQLLLSAIAEDLHRVPTEPLCRERAFAHAAATQLAAVRKPAANIVSNVVLDVVSEVLPQAATTT
jgi:glycosyltransferase involved in cell wall biosynthesis